MKPWLLADVSWLGYRAMCVMQGMSYKDMPTGVVFGFLEELRSVAFDPRVCTNQVALFFDSRQSVRRDFYPEYKSNRSHSEKTPEEWAQIMVMKRQVKLLRREILPECGFPCYRQTGMESDDLIAQAAKQIDDYDVNGRAIIVTADGDLYQCVTDAIHWFDPSRNVYLNPIGVWQKKGITPDRWGEVKCLAGCSGDGVPGIPGVGEKTAVQYLLGLTKHTHKKHQAIESWEGIQIAERNRHLVVLPHANTQPLVLKEPVYDSKAFYRWAKDLGFESYLDGGRRRAWDRFFAGDLDSGRVVPRRRGESRVA